MNILWVKLSGLWPLNVGGRLLCASVVNVFHHRGTERHRENLDGEDVEAIMNPLQRRKAA
jgi:hypothetical protein